MRTCLIAAAGIPNEVSVSQARLTIHVFTAPFLCVIFSTNASRTRHGCSRRIALHTHTSGDVNNTPAMF